MEENEEVKENMTVQEVAKIMNKGEQFVRIGLQQKRFPFRKCSI